MILLDTTFLIDYFRGRADLEHLVEGGTVITTTLNYHEIMTGVKRSKSKREESFFKAFFTKMDLLDFNTQAAEESSLLSATLSALGIPVNNLDVLIAGTALAHGIDTILTRDSDFIEIGKISDLCIKTYTTDT
jgi:tRNA(fMet)-specific endonuclease VapC